MFDSVTVFTLFRKSAYWVLTLTKLHTSPLNPVLGGKANADLYMGSWWLYVACMTCEVSLCVSVRLERKMTALNPVLFLLCGVSVSLTLKVVSKRGSGMSNSVALSLITHTGLALHIKV